MSRASHEDLAALRHWLAFYAPPAWQVWTLAEAYAWTGDRSPDKRPCLVLAGGYHTPGHLREMSLWVVDLGDRAHWRFGARHNWRPGPETTPADLALDAARAALRYTGITRVQSRPTLPCAPLPTRVEWWHADGRMLDIRGDEIGRAPWPVGEAGRDG